jgi:hypothetical protein
VVKAVIKGGEIRPLDPLPADWQEGQPLRVDRADEVELTLEEIDREFSLLERLCANSDPADEAILDQALHQARQQAKDQVRRQMGLPDGGLPPRQ